MTDSYYLIENDIRDGYLNIDEVTYIFQFSSGSDVVISLKFSGYL